MLYLLIPHHYRPFGSSKCFKIISQTSFDGQILASVGQGKFLYHFTTSQSSPLHISITPQILSSFEQIYDFCENFVVLRDLKQYRPHRRPIVASSIPESKRNNATLKRKRRLIVRDWFFYVVWYVRLRKIFNGIKDKGIMRRTASLADDKYYQILQILTGRPRLGPSGALLSPSSKDFNLRFPKLKVSIFASLDPVSPSFEVEASGLALNLYRAVKSKEE